MLGEVDRSKIVDSKCFCGLLLERGRVGPFVSKSGVVHEDVEPAEVLVGGAEHLDDGGLVADVGPLHQHGGAGGAQFVRERTDVVARCHVVEDQVVVGRRGSGDRRADAVGADLLGSLKFISD